MRYGLVITAGENRCCFLRLVLVVESHADAGARLARRASADGVHDHQDRTGAGGEKPVDIGGGTRFFDAVAGEVLPHGRDELFGIGHLLLG